MEWNKVTLDKLCDFKNGLWKGKKGPFIHVGIIRNTNFTKGGLLDDSDIAYLDVEEKQYKTRKLEFGDLILEKSGGGPKQPVGRVIPFEKTNGEFSFSNFTSIIRIRDKTLLEYSYLHKFLHYLYTTGATEQMQRQSTGIRNLQLKEYKLIDVPFPSILEQKRIVSILDTVFADLEQVRAKTEQNLKNARDLFDSYLQKVFSQKGDGWTQSKLIDTVNIVDSLHKTPKYSDDGYPMVRVTDIKSGELDLSNTRKVDQDTYLEFSKRYKANIGDIVFSRVGSYGRSVIVNTNEPFCLGQNTVFLAPKFNGYYFYYFLNSPVAKEQIDKMVSGSTQPTVSLKSIRSILIPIPTETEQAKIVKQLNSFENKVNRLEEIYRKKSKSIDELKKSILQKAFSGELTATAN